jgi:hypothetical protein
MNSLRSLLLLQLAVPLAFSAFAQRSQPTPLAKDSDALVRSLYTQVVARHPIGIPSAEEMKIFSPYLSKALLHTINLAIECSNDWHRKNPQSYLKPELGWLELGLFSGENERASPQSFFIENTQEGDDGSVRVRMKLTRAYSEGPPSIWRVVAVVTREDGGFALADVIYLRDEDYPEGHLSEALSAGCDGPRWVGFDKKRGDPKKQR